MTKMTRAERSQLRQINRADAIRVTDDQIDMLRDGSWLFLCWTIDEARGLIESNGWTTNP